MSYRLEYAKLGTSKCRGPAPCTKSPIAKGSLRCGTLVTIQGNSSFAWRHWGCVTPKQFENMRSTFGSAEELDGYEDLTPEDQARVKKAFEQGHVDDEDIPDSARKPVELDEEGNPIETPKKKGTRAPKEKVAQEDDEEEEEEKPKKAKVCVGAMRSLEDSLTSVNRFSHAAPKKRTSKRRKEESEEEEEAAATESEEETKPKKAIKKPAKRKPKTEEEDDEDEEEEEKPKKKAAAKNKAAPKKAAPKKAAPKRAAKKAKKAESEEEEEDEE